MEPYIINQTGDQLQSILNKAIIKAELQTTEDGNQAIRFTASDGTSISITLPEAPNNEYLLRNIYYLQEGIGCAAFDYTMSLGGVTIQSEEVTRQDSDSIILDTSANRFVLERSGSFYTKFLSNGASLQGSDTYASSRHTFLNRQDKSYWYRKEDGTLAQGSSTFVIANWLKELQEYVNLSETEITQHASLIADLRAKIKELGAFDTFAALFAQAAKFDIVSNNAIALLHGTYKQADGIYHGVLILQQVEMNNDGGGTAMQYIYIEKRKYTRYIYFSATAITAVQGVQNDGARNLSLSGRVLQMKDMWGNNVGSGATIPDNGNLYEGAAGASSVPVVLSKTFGGTVTAMLGAATSARAGVMTAADKVKLDKVIEETPWAGNHMNAFTESGEFHIYGERTNANDGLPIINSGGGHTIDARLTVLDSNLTNGTGAKTDIVVTQILRLSNRTGGDGHVYVRTAQAATKSQLATPSSTAWGTWEKLMGIFEKNSVKNIADLDTYTTNGMYSGLFADTTLQTLGGLQFTPGDTFLLITVNGYAASAFGTPQLTQMLYRLPAYQNAASCSARMYMRTAYWNASAKAWTWAAWDRLVTESEAFTEDEFNIFYEEEYLPAIDGANSLATEAANTANDAQNKNGEQDARLDALENPPAPDYAEMIIEAPATRHYKLFYDVRCIGWLEIDGEEAELPVITGDRAASYYAVLSQGRHVVRFRPKDGDMSDGTPYKERQGLLGWCDDNCVTEITLPEGWDVINIKMFEGAASLRRVNLPSTIREVRYGAFGNCAALEEIVLPPSVNTIQAFIVHDCPALKRIVLGGGNIAATGTLAQSCAALECVEFRAGGTVDFSGSANTFVNLPQLARFIVRGNFPTFECSQPFTSSGYVGSGVAAEARWIFTADGLVENGTKWQTSLLSQCGFTANKILSYTLN